MRFQVVPSHYQAQPEGKLEDRCLNCTGAEKNLDYALDQIQRDWLKGGSQMVCVLDEMRAGYALGDGLLDSDWGETRWGSVSD